MTARSHNRRPGPGETRSCTDPWAFVFIMATGDVALCCRSGIVANLGERSLDSILEGPEAVELRRRLLTGDLPQDCIRCAERGVATLPELREEVERLLFEGGLDELEHLRVQVRGLQDVRAEVMRERTGLLQHARDLEEERNALREHAETLEAERPHLRGHIANLEAEREGLSHHAAELDSERSRLRERVAALERELEMPAHQEAGTEPRGPSPGDGLAELEGERAAWVREAEELTHEREALAHRLAALESEKQGLEGHIANLESERSHLAQHASNLERDREALRLELQSRGEIGRSLLGRIGRLGRKPVRRDDT